MLKDFSVLIYFQTWKVYQIAKPVLVFDLAEEDDLKVFLVLLSKDR